MITHLKDNEVFVFGSNEAGRHGKGAAKQALKWGAVYGHGEGHYGQTYAIPTKDRNIQTLPLKDIEHYIDRFTIYAIAHPEYRFLMTKIGTGLAGYSWEEIEPLCRNLPDNVIVV